VTGLVCLQGGGEFSRGCREMDAYLITRAPGPVAVVALASAPGREHARAQANGARHFRALGAEVLDVPDPRSNPVDLTPAGLVVLPGGSPSRLRAGLVETGIGAALRRHVAAGGAVMGASAGAMLLCAWTVLPEEGPRLDSGLGLVPGVVVVPHWTGERDAWLEVITAGTVLGLREESGVLVEDGVLTAMGQAGARIVRQGIEVGVGSTYALP
jgi:cyanophycinase-like exopeptidase